MNSSVLLDEFQQAAVSTNSKRALVLAGAGSGKTRVLTERIRHLLNNGVEPHNIVAITYTNMAADEMKQRIATLPGSGDILIGTIHSLANKILQASGETYEILDNEKSNQIWQDLIKQYCTDLTFEKYLKYMDLQQLVELGKASEGVLEDFLVPSEAYEYTELSSSTAYDSKRFPVTVQQESKRRGYITFDELLQKATQYFMDIGASLEHLLVDELQDIGTLEYKFIRTLNASSYFFVGDDKQAIYGFKGADVRIFESIAADIGTQKYYLPNNYRNPQVIISLGSKILQFNDQLEMPDMVSASGDEGEAVKIMGKGSLQNCLEEIKDSGAFADWFVLARTNRQLNEISEALDAAGVPFIGITKSTVDLSQLGEFLAGNYVKIMTVHASKGLETNNVLLYGHFPVIVPRYRLNEEERRVMYVGVTRAKKTLWILN